MIVNGYEIQAGANLSGANLSEADLSGADLSEANLSGADLYGANLSEANLRGANLHGANLRGANLSEANLCGANLSEADLCRADLCRADLCRANLRGVDLREADLRGAIGIDPLTVAQLSIVPQTGSFIGWKKCRNNVIVALRIPENAKRSNATGRKCRAEFVEVVNVYGASFGISQYDETVKYWVGTTVHCDEWNPVRWTECGGGIHFFLTREEAENY